MHKRIESQDISVIVRGLVVGQNETDAAMQYTRRALESIRKHLPNAELILSTWKGSDVSGLTYDMLVISEEPEPLYMTHPNGEVRHITTNNQLISTSAGLAKATRPYIVNMRSDIEFQSAKFLDVFQKFNAGAPTGHFRKKIVVLPTYNPRRGMKYLFDVCDWFYFGLAEDIRDLFDIPLMEKSGLKGTLLNGYPLVEENLGCEAYIWTHFLEKHGERTVPNQKFFSEEALKESERSYAENTIMAPASLLKLQCLKMPHAGYGARPWLSQGLYTFSEYKHLYNRHNTPKLFILPNPFEVIAYKALLALRNTFRRYPVLYKIIVNAVRKLHGSSNLLK